MKRILLLFTLYIFAAFATAADISRVDIVIAVSKPSYNQLAREVQQELLQQGINQPIKIRINPETNVATASHALLINIGESQLAWTYSDKNNYAATINFYVNSIDLDNNRRFNGKVTALYRDQPLARQLRLAKLLIPNLHRVAVLYDHDLPTSINRIQRESGLEINSLTLRSEPDWAKSLSQLIQHNDILLGIDDPRVYNSETIRSILLTAYRHGKVLIGPSRPFVHAGSLASCYTSLSDYLQQLGTMVKTRIRQRHLPPPQFPHAFNIAVNPQVAVSLNLSIPDEKTLSAWAQNQLGDCDDGC